MAHCLNREKKQNFWWATMYVEAHIFEDCILNRIPFADVWCTWYKGCTHVYKHTQNSKFHFEVTFSFGSLSWFLKTFSNGSKVSQFSCSVMSDSLWPHGLQHARLPCPSPTLRACSNSCPFIWWCQRCPKFCDGKYNH